jgi:hypothetical protein
MFMALDRQSFNGTPRAPVDSRRVRIIARKLGMATNNLRWELKGGQ